MPEKTEVVLETISLPSRQLNVGPACYYNDTCMWKLEVSTDLLTCL